MTGPAWIILPTYDEAENLERDRRRGAPRPARRGARRLPRAGRRRRLARRDGRDRRRACAAEPGEVAGAAPPGREGLGPAYLAGFARALAGGAGLRLRDGRRLLPRPRRPRRACSSAVRERRRPRAGLALRRRAAASPTGALLRRFVSARRLGYARRCSAWRCATSPAGSSASAATSWRRSTSSVRSHGYAFQVELTYRAVAARVPRRGGPDRLPRPRARAARRCPGGSPPRPCWLVPDALRRGPALEPAPACAQGPMQRGGRRRSAVQGVARRARRCRAWSRALASRPGRWSPAALASGLLAVWVVATGHDPDPTPTPFRRAHAAGDLRRRRPRPRAQPARAGAARDGLRGRLHRGQLAARCRPSATSGVVRTIHDNAGPRRHRLRRRRHDASR